MPETLGSIRSSTTRSGGSRLHSGQCSLAVARRLHVKTLPLQVERQHLLDGASSSTMRIRWRVMGRPSGYQTARTVEVLLHAPILAWAAYAG